MVDSIKAHGQYAPILVQRSSRRVLKGHHVLEALYELEAKQVAVTWLDVDDTKALEILLADNRSSDFSSYDYGLLSKSLRVLEDMGGSLGASLWTDEDRARIFADVDRASRQLQADPDDVPEPPATPICQAGELWALGRHRLLCGDATSEADVQRLLDDPAAGPQLAAMIFTDPPYNVDAAGGTHNFNLPSYRKGRKMKGDKLHQDDHAELVRKALANAAQAVRPGGAMYLCHADTAGHVFRLAMLEAGFHLAQCLIWQKSAFVFGRSDYHWQHEPILYGWRVGAAHEFFGPTNETTIWEFDRPGPSTMDHPTQKPVELIERAIHNSSAPQELVLDLFCGSGSTLIASELQSRRCYAMEIEPTYCDVILRRWQRLTGELPVRCETGEHVSFDEAVEVLRFGDSPQEATTT